MYSTTWVNYCEMDGLEIKDTFIEFAINNVSNQFNVKIILNLKMEEICRDCCPNFFCGKSDNAPGFCLALSEICS